MNRKVKRRAGNRGYDWIEKKREGVG